MTETNVFDAITCITYLDNQFTLNAVEDLKI